MPRQFEARVVGVTFDNDDGTNRQHVIAKCRDGETVYLVPEPDNPHDSNAIKVCRTNGRQIGYLERDLASDLSGHLASGGKLGAAIRSVIGGGRGESLGVILSVAAWDRLEIPALAPRSHSTGNWFIGTIIAILIALLSLVLLVQFVRVR